MPKREFLTQIGKGFKRVHFLLIINKLTVLFIKTGDNRKQKNIYYHLIITGYYHHYLTNYKTLITKR